MGLPPEMQPTVILNKSGCLTLHNTSEGFQPKEKEIQMMKDLGLLEDEEDERVRF